MARAAPRPITPPPITSASGMTGLVPPAMIAAARPRRRPRLCGALAAGQPDYRRGALVNVRAWRRLVAAARAANRGHQFGLGHLAAAFDIQFSGSVIDLVSSAVLHSPVGVTGALGCPIRRSSFDATALVDGARRDLLGF